MSGKVIVKEKKWFTIRGLLKAAEGSYVEVGVLSDTGAYESGGGVNLADVATFNEYGTSRIPARPFLQTSFDSNASQINAFKQKIHQAMLAGQGNIAKGLEAIGIFFKGVVQKQIAKGGFAANAPSTIKQKGSSKPLIDTGRLRQSINYKVHMKGAK